MYVRFKNREFRYWVSGVLSVFSLLKSPQI